MPRMIAEHRGPWLPEVGDGLRGRLGLAEREKRRGPSTGLLIGGIMVVGLGILAWSYLGPDLRRYIKIHNM